MFSFASYDPGRFSYLKSYAFVQEIWDFLTYKDNYEKMTSSVESGKPAIAPLIGEIEEKFSQYLESTEFPDDDIVVLINNMLKQIMILAGYSFVACGLCRGAKYIKSSGVYDKIKS